ncbi:unnamed protein product, partial [Callosobruchus maculatus]
MAAEEVPDRIAEIFNGTTIFITGASGFVGKALIEKLLRLTNLRKMYLLLREKKGKSPEQRLQDIFTNVTRHKNDGRYLKEPSAPLSHAALDSLSSCFSVKNIQAQYSNDKRQISSEGVMQTILLLCTVVILFALFGLRTVKTNKCDDVNQYLLFINCKNG